MTNHINAKIEILLKQMTLDEKIGQLRQCGPSLVGAFSVSFEELLDMLFDGRIPKAEFDELMSTAEQDFHEDDLRAGKVGSYNGIGDAATANRLQRIVVEESRLHIPLLFGYDVIHGFRTITPIPLAESCAWDPDLWERTARIAAEEATAAGIHMTFAPMVDVAKDARWGRISEGAGEDTLLNALYGAAKVRGYQGQDLRDSNAMAACVKHFAAYGAAEAGKDYNRVDMSMQRLHEEYLPPYKACIDAGARAIMPAFNDINGVPCTVNKWLLQDVLRKQWGFDGMTISDANSIAESVNHGVASSRRDAAKAALEAGMDMDMTSNVYSEHLHELIESGDLPISVLDKAVGNILRVKFELGLFDNPYQTSVEREQRTLLMHEHRELAREAACKSMVLLKNDILPLPKTTKLGIFGKLAASKDEMTGAWAIGAHSEDCISLLDACDARDLPYQYCKDDAKLEQISDESDVLIAVMGEDKSQSGEAASRADITLPKEQLALLDALIATGKPVVALLFSGRPLVLTPVASKVNALVQAWHLGIEAGNAIVDILLGDVNPSGKLTATIPHESGQCPIYYAHINTGRPGGKSKFTSKYLDTPLEPLYPFGYGLSYTQYEYSDMNVTKETNGFTISVSVTNIGSREGDEIVQCYVQDTAAQRARPVKELKAFCKLSLAPSETKTATFFIPLQDLGYYNQEMEHVVEAGQFVFYVGGDSQKLLSQEAYLKKSAFNPYLPFWETIPDAEPHVFNDRVYIYGSHDLLCGTSFCEDDYRCWSAPVDDLGNWRSEGIIYRKEQDPINGAPYAKEMPAYEPQHIGSGMRMLYAPDATQGPDGRYYLYYGLDTANVISVAVSDSPAGKYEFLDYVRRADGSIPTVGRWFDPAILCESSGNYLYYGFCPAFRFPGMEDADIPGAMMVMLSDDMHTIISEPVCVANGVDTAAGTSFEAHPFFEAPSIRKYGDWYYLVYSSLQGHELCYGMARAPQGPFEYQGVIVSNGDIGYQGNQLPVNYTGNNHGGLVQIKDELYIFGHRHTQGTSFSRQGCADKVEIAEDGRIAQIQITSCGLNGGPLPAKAMYQTYIACHLTEGDRSKVGQVVIGMPGAPLPPLPESTPYITHEDDPSATPPLRPYIHNLQKGAIAGFKYLDFIGDEKTVTLTLRGVGAVEVLIDSPEGEMIASIDRCHSKHWHTYSSPIKAVKGVHALYFKVRDGSFDFAEFSFA